MRLVGLDIARFAAFVGMLLVNFRIASATTDEAHWSAMLTHGIEGRAAALFVVLAGVGLGLGRPNPWLTAKRAGFLFSIGMVDLVIFEADILHFYALYFLVALPFLTASRTTLMGLALGAILLGFVALIAFDYEAGWNWETLYYADFWTLTGFLRHSFYNGWHPVLPWVGFLFWGMALSRMALGTRRVQLTLLVAGTLAALGCAALSRALVAIPDLGEAMTLAPMPPGPLYMLAASASASAAIGLALLVEPLLTRARLTPYLAAPGRQTLTLYAAHVVLGMGLPASLGWLDGRFTSAQVFTYSLTFAALAAVYARVWSQHFKHGPLETLMRRITETRP